MRAYCIALAVLLLWNQESHCEQSQGEQSLQKLETTFIFDITPPKKDETITQAGEGDQNVTANAVPGYDDFWNDKMIQSTNQVDEVLKYTVPDFQSKINETYNIVKRMRSLNDDRLSDAKIVFTESTKAYQVSLEMLVNIKNLPTYNNTVDYVKQWVESSLNETAVQLPKILLNSEKLQTDAQKDLDFLKETLTGFTAEKLRRICYPNVRCATLRLSQLKDLIFRTRETVLRVLNMFIGFSISIDSVLFTTITHQKNEISDTARTAGLQLLANNNVTRSEINAYFIRYHLSQNQYNLYVQSQLNKTLNCIYEYDYRNVRCKNFTKNAINAAGYPVVDAYNTVNLLGRNRNGKVLGNETTVTRNKVLDLSKEMTPQTPNFGLEIAVYFEQAYNHNQTIYQRTDYYINNILAVDFIGDDIDWYIYLDARSRETDLTVLDVVSKDLEHLLNNCTARIQTNTIEYNKWLGGTLPARIDDFHLTDLEPVGDGLYTKGNITHNEIFYFGSLNLNSTYRTWKPKLDEAIASNNALYLSIIQKNYTNYSIYEDLLKIVSETVFPTFDEYKSVFNPNLIALLNVTVVQQLVRIPSDEYKRLANDSLREIERNYNSSLKYNGESARIRSDLDAYIKKGPQSYGYHRSPRVEHSHQLSTKVYDLKVEFLRLIDNVNFITKDMGSVDDSLTIYADTVKSKIRAVCEEYRQVIKLYVKAVASGSAYVNALPSCFPIFARYFREMHFTVDAEFNPMAKIIDIPIF